MTTPWQGNERTRAGDTFETLHRGLTVGLISTPRDDLKTCSLDDSVADVVMHATENYDYLPVTAEEGGRIVGLFHAVDFTDKSRPAGRVREHCHPQLKEHLIGADASILDFVTEADCRPCRLVVSGTGIVGLVTLSDLQKLPVRAALFALVAGLEISMSEAIERSFPAPEDWRRFLSQSRQEKIEEEISQSRDRNGFVNELLFTKFCDKRDILTRLPCLSRRKKSLRDRLKKIEKLRDRLVHANDYAATPEEARNVCGVVRSLLELRQEIESAISSVSPAPDSERLERLRQAVHDPLFVSDLNATMEPFVQAESKWWESEG